MGHRNWAVLILSMVASGGFAVPVSYECGDYPSAPYERNRVLELHTGPGYALQACQNLLDVFNDSGVLVVTPGLPWKVLHSGLGTDETAANVFECRSGADDTISWLHSLDRHTCCVLPIAELNEPRAPHAFSFTEIKGFRPGHYGDTGNTGASFTLIECDGEIGNFGNWITGSNLSNVGAPVAAPVPSAGPVPFVGVTPTSQPTSDPTTLPSPSPTTSDPTTSPSTSLTASDSTTSPSISPTVGPTVGRVVVSKTLLTTAGGGSASTEAKSTGSFSKHRVQLSRQRRRIVTSITLPTIGAAALMSLYDDVAEVTTDIVIENTDLTSLAGWFPNLVLVTGNVQITNNAALTTMDDSFQKLETVTGYVDIFGNGALVELGSALPFPGGLALVTGYVSIYNNPVLLSLGSAFHGLVTITGYCTIYANAVLATLGTAFDNLLTITGHLDIYANPLLASMGTAFSSVLTVTGYASVANNPVLYCAVDVGSLVVMQSGSCQLTAVPTGPPTTSPASSSPSTPPTTSPVSSSPSTLPSRSTFSPTAEPTTAMPTTSPSARPTTAPSSSSPSTPPSTRPTSGPATAIPTIATPTAAPVTTAPSLAPSPAPTGVGWNMASTAVPGVSDGGSGNTSAATDQTAVLVAVILFLLFACSVGLFRFKGLRRSRRDEAKASQAREASVPNPAFMSATDPSMQVGAMWEQGINVDTTSSVSSATDEDGLSVSDFEARRSSAASTESAISVDLTRRSSSASTESAMSAPLQGRKRRMTDWGDGLGARPVSVSGTSHSSLVSNQTVFGYDPNGNGGTLSRMNEPFADGSEMLDGVPVARLATDATSGGSLFWSERAHQPAGRQSVPSGARTAVNPTYQPQAPCAVNPSPLNQSQGPGLERDDPTVNGDAYVEVESGVSTGGEAPNYDNMEYEHDAAVTEPVEDDTYEEIMYDDIAAQTFQAGTLDRKMQLAADGGLRLISVRRTNPLADMEPDVGDTPGSSESYLEVAPHDRGSAYGPLGTNGGRPALSSGGMYASLGTPVAGSTAAAATDNLLAQSAMSEQPATYEYEAGPTNTSEYSVCGDVVTASASTNDDQTVIPPAAYEYDAGSTDAQSNDYETPSVDRTPTYGTLDASAGRSESDALYSTLNNEVDMGIQLSDNGAELFYNPLTPSNLNLAGYGSPTAPAYSDIAPMGTYEPIGEESGLLGGAPVACLATVATSGDSLFYNSAERPPPPAGGQSALSGARTTANLTYQPQAQVLMPGRGAVKKIKNLVAPDDGASTYGTLGTSVNGPASNSGSMYASLGAPVTDSAAGTTADEADRQAAVRFDRNGADHDYDVFEDNKRLQYEAPHAHGNSEYETPSVDRTPTYGTLDASAGRSESDAMYSTLNKEVDLERQLSDNGAGLFYNPLTPSNLKPAEYDSSAAPEYRDIAPMGMYEPIGEDYEPIGEGSEMLDGVHKDDLSTYGTLGTSVTGPASNSGSMYASLGAPVTGSIAAATTIETDRQAAVRFADHDYDMFEALQYEAPHAHGNSDYETPSVDRTPTYGTLDASAGRSESDDVRDKIGTAVGSTCPALTQPAAAGGGAPGSESEDMYVELGATAAAGSTQAAAAGKADNAYAALVPPGSVVPVDTPVDMEKPRSDNGTDEFFYNALCKGIENEKMLNRLRAATSPPWEEPAGEPDYAEPMYTGRRQRRGTPLYSAPPEYTTCDQDPDDAEYAEVDGSLDGSLVS